RSQARLDPWLGAEPPLYSLLGHQPRTDHDRGIGGIGAASDGRDDDGSVVQLDFRAFEVALHDGWRVRIEASRAVRTMVPDGHIGTALAHPPGIGALSQLLARSWG